MIYGLIVAAGKQSRFESSCPKCLMPFQDSTILDINLETMNKFVDESFVVVSKENASHFGKYLNTIEIESGFGCGDAVLKALEYILPDSEDTAFVIWGDSIQNKPEIYEKCLTNLGYEDILLPVVYEEKPYVQIQTKDQHINGVLFSKYEKTYPGYHDLSLFYFNGQRIKEALSSIREEYFQEFYNLPHGQELQFLEIFNLTFVRGSILEFKDIESCSFNTIEEYNKLKELK